MASQIGDEGLVEGALCRAGGVAEYRRVRGGTHRDGADAVQVFPDIAARRDKLAGLALAPHGQHRDRLAVLVRRLRHVVSTQVARLGGPHARIAHDEDELINHGPIPSGGFSLCGIDPFGASVGM